MVGIARGTSRDIRVANRSEVLRHIIAESTVSRQRVAAQSGLSLATVSNLIGELLEAGVLVEVGFEDSSGGRPRGLVSVDPSGGVLIGVDVAETYVHVELFDTALRMLTSAEQGLHPKENRPEQVVGHIVSGVRTVLGRTGVAVERVLGAGISVPGQVDRGGGFSVFAPNGNWHDIPLRGLLAEGLTMPLVASPWIGLENFKALLQKNGG